MLGSGHLQQGLPNLHALHVLIPHLQYLVSQLPVLVCVCMTEVQGLDLMQGDDQSACEVLTLWYLLTKGCKLVGSLDLSIAANLIKVLWSLSITIRFFWYS